MTLPPDLIHPDSRVRALGSAPLGSLAEAREPDSDFELQLKAIRHGVLERRPILAAELRRLTRLSGVGLGLLKIRETDDYVFLASQLPTGRDLPASIAAEHPSSADLLVWTRSLFRQLADAHAAEVLHRSIGPQSIRIHHGEPVLFGFSANCVAAAPSMRAPEVSTNDPADPNHSTRSDVYALGRVLEELVSGLPPNERGAPWIMVIASCTNPNPDARPSDAAAVLSALSSTSSSLAQPAVDHTETATPTHSPSQSWKSTTPPFETADLTTDASGALGSPSNGVPPEPTELGTSPPDPQPPRRVKPVPLVAAIVFLLAVAAVAFWQSSWIDSPSPATPTEDGPVETAIDRPEAHTAESESDATPTADHTRGGQTLTPSPSTADPEDAALALAESIVQGNQATLFAGSDQELRAELGADLSQLDFGDDPRGREIATSLFGANPLTQDRNPLLNPEVRQAWIAEAIRNVGDRDLLAHLTSESDKLRSGTVTLAEWYEHVAACKEVCNLIVLGLLQEHIRRVQQLPHQLVLFDVNQDSLAPSQQEQLEQFVARAAGGGRVLLIGRASRTGNRQFNRELSRRRVEATGTAVQALGVAPEYIESLWLGYEPPQITNALAARYSVGPDISEVQRNQSVLVVTY